MELASKPRYSGGSYCCEASAQEGDGLNLPYLTLLNFLGEQRFKAAQCCGHLVHCPSARP